MTMTLISRIKKINYLLFAILVIFNGFTNYTSAQESLTLSISPSLYDMSVNPNQEWRSTLRIINVNNYDLTVYINVVNFLPQGESGSGRFVPVTEDSKGSTLAEWFNFTSEPILIPREQSIEVPFSVIVPKDASPGGHFAAIMVGTKPPENEPGQTKVQTAQFVTSLFFARVSGDIVENGLIREFSVKDSFLERPEASFDLRFENKGNVHLQPQGEIKIYNMWGQERGVIPINQSSQFGNVLPESIRNFTFSWKGEWSFSDIGRYTAEANIAYGIEERKFATNEVNFWVIPFKLLLYVLLFLTVFVLGIIWLVKIYIRHTLKLAGININDYRKTNEAKNIKLGDIQMKPVVSFRAPVRVGLLDLQDKLKAAKVKYEQLKVLLNFLLRYKLFFGALLFVAMCLLVIVWYVLNANTEHRGYEVIYENSDSNVTLTSEEIIYNQLLKERTVEKVEKNSTLTKVAIVNRSGIPGMGAETKIKLESVGYEVVSLAADFSSLQKRTVIIYGLEDEDQALKLSSKLNKAPVSLYKPNDQKDYMTVYVGDDLNKE